MNLTDDEKKVIKNILERQLQEFRVDEVKRDVPLQFLHAENEYEKILQDLIKKF